jgi:hypothetical protein
LLVIVAVSVFMPEPPLVRHLIAPYVVKIGVRYCRFDFEASIGRVDRFLVFGVRI